MQYMCVCIYMCVFVLVFVCIWISAIYVGACLFVCMHLSVICVYLYWYLCIRIYAIYVGVCVFAKEEMGCILQLSNLAKGYL